MLRLFQNLTHASIKIDSLAENIENREQALIFMIAIQAYLDMVFYKKNLLKTLAEGIQPKAKHRVEQQHRYSVVFFLHPWEPSGESYGAYLFSLIGKESLFTNLVRLYRSKGRAPVSGPFSDTLLPPTTARFTKAEKEDI